jgi:DNA repair protein RadD
MTITLRPEDQEVSVAETRRLIAAGIKRILIQAPCGFGKTVVGAYIAMMAVMKTRRVLFLVHREELAMQASRTFTAFGVKHGFIMAGLTFDQHQKVYVGMIDTVRPRLKSGKLALKFDIVIADECHHSVSPTWRNVLDHYAGMGAVILGLSATPQRLSGEPLGDVFDAMVDGPPVRDLIERGSLSDFTYYAPPSLVDTSGIKEKFGDFARKDLELATDKPQIIGDAIEHYKKLMPGKRAIVFAVTIEHSKHIVAQFNAAGIRAAHVDGETPGTERKESVKAFERGEILILSNVSLFGEGFDVKACEGVILLRATASLSLHIQMTMRPMRPHESKDRAIIIDHVGNFARHGLPDADHEWTLEGKKKKKGAKKLAQDDIEIKQCPKCYIAHLPAPACPGCGHVYAVKARALEQVDGELAEITPEMREAIRKEKMKEQGRAQSVDELIALGHNKYAAERIIKARAEKQEVISKITADLIQWQEQTGQMPFPIFGVSFRDIRYMKPKELKALRERFDAHKAEYLAARSGKFELESL